MKQYRNKNTGVIIATNSEITGKNWEPVKVPSKKPVKKGAAKK